MMKYATLAVLFVALVCAEFPSIRARRDDKVHRYCQKHEQHYHKYCKSRGDVHSDKVAKFCPAYEKHCLSGSSGPSDDLVMPPSLPKGSDMAMMDLPIGSQSKPRPSSGSGGGQSSTRLTSAIIASCTPDCTAPHCTDECKCANTHPKVHQMCNPPSSAALAETCQKWYSKCTMFQPVSY